MACSLSGNMAKDLRIHGKTGSNFDVDTICGKTMVSNGCVAYSIGGSSWLKENRMKHGKERTE